jgi:hypothetical protein
VSVGFLEIFINAVYESLSYVCSTLTLLRLKDMVDGVFPEAVVRANMDQGTSSEVVRKNLQGPGSQVFRDLL